MVAGGKLGLLSGDQPGNSGVMTVLLFTMSQVVGTARSGVCLKLGLFADLRNITLK